MLYPTLWGKVKDTGVPISVLKEINNKINLLPEDKFNFNV